MAQTSQSKLGEAAAVQPDAGSSASTDLSAYVAITVTSVGSETLQPSPENGVSYPAPLAERAVPQSEPWHIDNPNPGGVDVNVAGAWEDYSGRGVIVGVVDDGIDYKHSDLNANINTSLDYDILRNTRDGQARLSDDYHGTAVAGLIAAENNGTGLTGIAYNAKLVSFRYLSDEDSTDDQVTDAIQAISKQVYVDVSNNSWGFDDPFGDMYEFYYTKSYLQDVIEEGRDGLGTVFVFAAGNERDAGGSANYSGYLNSRFTIAVAACDTNGEFAYFSNAGANVLVTAPGQAVYTTDLSGVNGGTTGNYQSISGTSFSSPITAGVVALMLEANPDLGYRDVQEILAYSSVQTDSSWNTWEFNGATNWNGGGLHVSEDYGFGLVDATAAVRLAETWTLAEEAHTFFNEELVSGSSGVVNLALADHSSVTSSFNIATAIDIQHAEVAINLTHGAIGDLVIKLVSPEGTESILMDRPEFGQSARNFSSSWLLSSVQNWGETGVGVWTLTIEDHANGDVGLLHSWSLTLYGDASSNDSTYIYTNEYTGFTTVADAPRREITDAAGTDTINASAVTGDCVIDLSLGVVSSISGNTLTLNPGTVIENTFTGDGDDAITGNTSDNLLFGGRGQDTVFGGGGQDTLIGSKGNDELEGDDGDDFFRESRLDGADSLDGGNGTDGVSYDDNTTTSAISFNAVTGVVTRDGQADQLTAIEQVIAADALADSFVVSGDSDGTNINLTTGVVSGLASGIVLVSQFENVTGGSGDDTIVGNSANNTICGGAGDDIIDMDTGNDTLLGTDLDGEDTYTGGGGVDTLNYDDNVVTAIYLDAVAETVVRNGETDAITGFEKIYATDALTDTFDDATDAANLIINLATGALTHVTSGITFICQFENAIGGSGNDVLIGNILANRLAGNAGNDTLNGGTGVDTLIGGAGNDLLNGGVGVDTADYDDGVNNLPLLLNAVKGVVLRNGELDVLKSIESVIATDAATDTLSASSDTDGFSINLATGVVSGLMSGITSALQFENVVGGSGNDTIIGNNDDNDLMGKGGKDKFFAVDADGSDTYNGGSGVDRLCYDDDILSALNFNAVTGEVIRNGDTDTLISIEKLTATDATDDHIDASAATNGVTVNLTTGVVAGFACGVVAVALFEDVTGGVGNDKLIGNAEANTLSGGDGNDMLVGGAGDDHLFGGDGNDNYTGYTGTFGADVIADLSGTDMLNLFGYLLSSAVWTALDGADADTNLDTLQISLGANSISIADYFNNSSTDDDSSAAGSGYIETIVFHDDSSVDFAQVQGLIA